MEQIINRIYVGGDADYEKVKDRDNFSILRCCKYGPGGHQETVGYKSRGAPKGPEYLAAKKGNRMALNYIDANDASLIPVEMIEEGLKYVDERLAAGDKVLIACNEGWSRGPTTAMLYLRSIGDLPHNFIVSERIFRTLYPHYNPGTGVRTFAKEHWQLFDNYLRKEKNGTA